MKPFLLFAGIITFTIAGCESAENTQTTLSGVWSEEERQALLDGLNRTHIELLAEAENLNEVQWLFKPDTQTWSIAEVAEHLELQDELYYRELFLILKRPETDRYLGVTTGNDQQYLEYASDPNRGQAPWNLMPTGRFCSREQTTAAFSTVRGKIVELIELTDANLRRLVTFRTDSDEIDMENPSIWDIRDLHQLMLTTIAHTDRHINQIRRIKEMEDFPE